MPRLREQVPEGNRAVGEVEPERRLVRQHAIRCSCFAGADLPPRSAIANAAATRTRSLFTGRTQPEAVAPTNALRTETVARLVSCSEEDRAGARAVAAVAAVVSAIALARAAGPAWPGGLDADVVQVAPIFAEKCAGCHTLGGIAPFSLRNARTARRHANGILVMTQLGRMPPWMPGHDSPAYLGQSQRILTNRRRRELIARWVQRRGTDRRRAAGQAVGEKTTSPGRTMARAHEVLLPEPSRRRLDDYHCFVLEPRLAAGRVRDERRHEAQRAPIVHHVILFEASGRNAVDARQLNAARVARAGHASAALGSPRRGRTRDSASNDRLGAPPWISAWVPGPHDEDTPPGTGVLVTRARRS